MFYMPIFRKVTKKWEIDIIPNEGEITLRDIVDCREHRKVLYHFSEDTGFILRVSFSNPRKSRHCDESPKVTELFTADNQKTVGLVFHD